MPFYYARHRFIVLALLRNRLESFRHDIIHVVADECQGVHRSDVNPAIPAIAIIHDVPYAVAVMHGSVDHPWSHESCIICLDLEIDVICMRVVLPIAGFWRHDAVQDVVPALLVCMPERIRRIGVSLCERLYRGIQSFFLEDFDEGEVHVDVVVESRRMVEVPFHAVLVPAYFHVVTDNSAVFEFRRPTVCASDCLASPSSFNLVQEHFFAQFH